MQLSDGCFQFHNLALQKNTTETYSLVSAQTILPLIQNCQVGKLFSPELRRTTLYNTFITNVQKSPGH